MRTLQQSIFPLIVVLLTGTFNAASAAQAAAPATQPSIVGKISAESEVPLSEMVVYLESPDANRPVAPPATQPVRVSQKEAQFSPRIVVVTVGGSVEFLNDEDRQIEHNVFSNSPAKRFDLGLYGPGESKTIQFDNPGPVFLYCSIHRYMDGVVFVSPTPYTSRVDNEGHYTLEGVPSGKWVLKTWQRRKRFPEKTIDVTVENGKTSTVDFELKRK